MTSFPIRVERFEPALKNRWDEFVRGSKNGVFLYHRDYLEYHEDRFVDHSLMFFQGDELVALMPANLAGDRLVSHGGLTFGGVVTDHRMKTPLMLEVFSALTAYLSGQGIKKLVYKAVPHIYHTLPAEEDLYALFRCGARLYRRDVSSTIVKSGNVARTGGRRHGLNRGRSQGLEVTRSTQFGEFMTIAGAYKQGRFGLSLVHTTAEIQMLASRFPDNIKLYVAQSEGAVLGGYLIYESANVAHAQYMGVVDEGRNLGVLDYILDVLLNDVYRDKPYFDFGISTVDDGHTLNKGLIVNKESYGARATVYDFYELSIEA